MAQVYAISGLAEKNNSGAVLHGGNVARNLYNLSLAVNATDHQTPGVVSSNDNNLGTIYAISGRDFGYNATSDQFVAMVIGTNVAGVADNTLRSGAGDFGDIRTDKPSSYTRLNITSWNAATGAATFGAGRGDTVVVSGIDNSTGPRADQGVYQSEYTTSGPGILPTQNDYPTRNG